MRLRATTRTAVRCVEGARWKSTLQQQVETARMMRPTGTVHKKRLLFDSDWLQLVDVQYSNDRAPHDRFHWMCVQRSPRRFKPGRECDGVVVFPVLNLPGQPPEVVLVSQFRPPLSKQCIELPAGLVDDDEDVVTAALRELAEETGFHAPREAATRLPFAVINDPGLTGSATGLVRVQIDGSDSRNQNPRQALEDSEDVRVLSVPLQGLVAELQNMFEASGGTLAIDAKLAAIAMGMQLMETPK